MTVRRSAVMGRPPIDLVFAFEGAVATYAPESETGETMAVPAGRPSGVLTLKIASPPLVRRTGVQLCGGVKSKGICGERTIEAGTTAALEGLLNERSEVLTAALMREVGLFGPDCAADSRSCLRRSARSRRARITARCLRHQAREWCLCRRCCA